MKVWTCEVCRLAHGTKYALPGDVRANLCPTCYHGFLRIFARAARSHGRDWRLGLRSEHQLPEVEDGRQA